MSENVIEIKNLKKEYKMFARKKDRFIETIFPFSKRHGSFSAMEDLNLEIKRGECLGILGKNGAGKSTLLKMITGVVTPTSGEIKVNGKISSLLELGTAFNPELTGYENIYQHGQVMGLTKAQIKEKEKDIIDFADIGDHLSQPVKTYSSGMFARLAFACAINVDPDILIVDEVLSVGDMAFQLKCFKKFEQFREMNKTIIFVTHNIGDVIRNCNKAIIIENGRKIYDGDVKTAVDKYKKIIVGMNPDDERKEEKEEVNKIKIEKTSRGGAIEEDVWKNNFNLNEEALSYGSDKAEIIDFGVFNKEGNYEYAISNDEEVTIKMKVKFSKPVENPIFAFSFKDFRGLEYCGINTLITKKDTGSYQKGDIAQIEFTQKLPLKPDKYTISFGCTRFGNNGNLEVFDRKYDVMFMEVLARRDCVGLFDLDSKIEIK